MARAFHALSVALALILAGCQLPGGSPGAPGMARSILAYTAAHEFALVHNSAVAGRVDGDFVAARAQFTADGRFAFAVEGGGHLVVIDSQNGDVRAFPAASETPVAEDASAVVWFEAPDRLMRMDLAADRPEPELRQNIQLPDSGTPRTEGPEPEVRVLGVSAGGVLLARTECPCDAERHAHLYLVGSDRVVQDLGVPATGAVSAPQLSADDGRLAYATNVASGADCETSTVVQVDLVSGIVGTSAVGDGCGPIDHLWWGDVGSLFAAADDGGGVPAVWKHGAGGWSLVEPGPVLEKRSLRTGDTAVLVPATDSAGPATLAIDAGEQRTELAAGVATIAVQPS
ncbi:hypothetical protein [Mycobacterium sp. 1274756.6]|uniref:hypothetical protein n=1 Tax=Mycobacterium sp. 1274756.6 TaxID=1834076 RepID=UPI000800DB06|nr:hypothetical protein [Mycobacterium sp. 1274756.6]OBJ69123.1 hypothetical protein A5643_12930 [Mycobacterium sp. 1274756.6]